MTEQWAIWVAGAVLSWVAVELHGIRKELSGFVLKQDCRNSMSAHCEEIGELRETLQKNTERITRIETKMGD